MKVGSNLLKEVGGVIETLSLSAREKQQLQCRITEVLLRWESESQGRQERLLSAEMGGNWLQRSWRPIVMLALAAVVLVGTFVPLPMLDDNSRFWDLLEIGLGGYILGRGVEALPALLGKRVKKNRLLNR